VKLRLPQWVLRVCVFVVIAAVLWVVVGVSVRYLPFWHHRPQPPVSPRFPTLSAWLRWDGGWYRRIALFGYFYTRGQQSPVAFFPVYPLLMRAGARLTGEPAIAGAAITVAAGAGVAASFGAWCSTHLPRRAVWAGTLALLLYPFAYFLYGAVYADAVFILAAIVAFVALDHDRPWIAGLSGAVATASRPTGLAVVAGLAAVALQARRARGQRPQARDAAVLLSAAGLLAWCGWLWARFGDPLAFVNVTSAPGWNQRPGPETWLKLPVIRIIQHSPFGLFHNSPILFQGLLTLAALALVPLVWRRFGWGYGAYVLATVGLPAIATKEFIGMGRYILAAFPIFALAGELRIARPRLAIALLAGSAISLLALTSLYARAYYVS
jgi:hypothetical protein